MASQTIGIAVDVQENASAVAPRIEQQFENIGKAGQQAGKTIQDAFDANKMSSQFEVFADKVDKLYDTKFGKQRELQLRYMDLRNQQMEQNLANKPAGASGGAKSAAGTLSRVGGAVSEVGSTGNAVRPGANILTDITGMVGKMGPVGKAIAGGGALLGAGAIVGDQLSKAYEAFVPSIMNATAALGELGKSTGENSLAFRKNLQGASESAAKFGYELETGVDVLGQLAHGGVYGSATSAGTSNVLSYARGYGVDPSQLVGAQILSQRYGQGNVLGLAAGGAQASGIGSGRYQEYLSAMSSMFEDSVSKGVTRSMSDISGTMNFFSKLGPMWQGQAGASKISAMNEAVSGATSLQNPTDVLLYRAARQTGGKGESWVDTMARMEGGITPEMFKSVYGQISQYTGGKKEDVEAMLKETFGVNWSQAKELYEAGQPGYKGRGVSSILEAPTATSAETNLIGAEDKLRLTIVDLGANVLDAKSKLVSGMADVVTALGHFAGVDPTSKKIGSTGKIESTIGTKAALDKYATYDPSDPDSAAAYGRAGLSQLLTQLTIMEAPKGRGTASSKETEAEYEARMGRAKKVEGALTGLTPSQMESLISSGKMGEMYKSGQLSTKDVNALTKAINDAITALNQPSSITVSSATVPSTSTRRTGTSR